MNRHFLSKFILSFSLSGAMLISGISPAYAAEINASAPIESAAIEFDIDNPATVSSDVKGSLYSSLTHGNIVDGYYIYKVSAEDIANSTANKVIQNALDEANSNATASLPYKIVIQPGSYEITKRLLIYSNTYLYMEGVTLIQPAGKSTNMLKVGDATDTKAGYYYQNITIDGGSVGGTFNESGNSNTALKIAHAKNFTMKNITVMNTVDAHLMEVAGVDGLTIQNCTFKDQVLVNTSYYEGIQLDYLITGHFKGFAAEDLTIKNVVIDGCTFSNLPRGIGAHTSILNNYMNNIAITNNLFINHTSAAIQLMSFLNCNISGNTITNCPRGIILYSIRGNGDGTYLSTTPASQGGVPTTTPTTYVAPPLNQNIVVSNNNISLQGSDNHEASYENVGIFLGGFDYSASAQTPQDSSDIIPAGDYYLSGATISGNSIITTDSGVLLQHTKNSTIRGNQISFTGTKSNCHGILLRTTSTDNVIESNSITTCPGNAIALESASSASSISGNATSSPTTCGIYVSNNSSVGNIYKNTISHAGYAGIFCAQGTISAIAQNNILSCSGNAIFLNGSVINGITQNVISSSAASGIFLNVATVGNISENSISSCRSSGISANLSVVNSISSNSIANTGTYGIEQNAGTINSITKNSLQGCTNYGIVIYNFAKLKNLTSNTVLSGKSIGIYINQIGRKLTVKSNTVKGCKTAQILISPNSTQYTVTVDSNKITGTKKSIGLRIDSGKVTVTGNKIYSCKTPIELSHSAKGTIKKNTYSKNTTNKIKVANASGSKKSYTALTKPTSVIASAVSKSSIRLSWNPVKNADGYYIYRSTSANGEFKKVATVKGTTKTSYTNKKLKKNTKYYYKVVAYSKSKNKNTTFLSADSKIVSKKTLKK